MLDVDGDGVITDYPFAGDHSNRRKVHQSGTLSVR